MRLSRLLLLLALFVLTQACAATHVTRASQPPPTSAEGKAKMPRAAKPLVKELSGCVDDRFSIDLLDAIQKIPDDTLDAQREQVRDWIFTVTLARIAHRLGAGEVMTGVLLEPAFRDDSLAHVLRMQSGRARSTTTKSGNVIVLVEAMDAATTSADVLQAIDDESLHLGNTPATAQVYQYVLKPEVARAEVCATKSLTRAEIESEAQQYRRATISTTAEFEKFLAGGVDLISAQCAETGLEVQGRQRPRAKLAPITVEHIAALSQARGTQYIPLQRFGFSLDKISNRAQLDKNASEIDALQGPLERQPRDIQVLHAWKRQNPGVSMQELMMSLQLQQESFGRPGFSLDPHPNASYSTYLLDEFITGLPDIAKVAAIFRGLKEQERATDIIELAEGTREPFAEEAKAALAQVRVKLAAAKGDGAIEAIFYQELGQSLGSTIAEDILRTVAKHSTQQCSRYDGPLYGTATGMTFFYTDLLAKVWSIDYHDASPEMDIEGFQSKARGAVSSASCSEVGGENTRTWLGLRDEGFAREATGAVRFAPMATRIFAKSSNAGARDKEFEANASSKRFVQWWDNHFAEVADWEPQYELLNQLMKWSAVVHQSTIEKKTACFAPLDGVKVRSDHRFDHWVTSNASLRWQGPVKLLPPPKGQVEKAGDPECMELLESRSFPYCDATHTISGGVSAADIGAVSRKPIRSPDVPSEFVRISHHEKPNARGNRKFEYAKIEYAGGKLENVVVDIQPRRLEYTAKIDVAASQRGTRSKSDPTAPIKFVAKSIQQEGAAITISEQQNRYVSAELKVSDLEAAAPKLEVKLGPTEQAKAKAQKVAKRIMADDVGMLDAAKNEFTEGERVFALKDGRLAFELPNSGSPPKFAIMESGGGNRGPPGDAEVSFFVGLPETTPHKAGSSEKNRAPVVHVTIVPASAVNLKQAEKIEPNGRDTIRTIRGLVRDDAALERAVSELVKLNATPMDLQQVADGLELARIDLARENRDDQSAIDKHVLMAAIAARKQQSAARGQTKPTKVEDAPGAIYAPVGYSLGAELPPAQHAPGKVLMPNEQYVERVLSETSSLVLPKETESNGVRLSKRTDGEVRQHDYAAVGSSLRLLGTGRRLVHVILPCNDRDLTMVPCHTRPSPEELQRYQEVMKCDLNGDSRLSGPEEINCLDAQAKQRRQSTQPTK